MTDTLNTMDVKKFPIKNHAFPISLSSRDKDGEVFSHQVVGGLSVRQYIAIEFMKGLLSNPAFVVGSMTTEKLGTMAIAQADKFLEKLEETEPTHQREISEESVDR